MKVFIISLTANHNHMYINHFIIGNIHRFSNRNVIVNTHTCKVVSILQSFVDFIVNIHHFYLLSRDLLLLHY